MSNGEGLLTALVTILWDLAMVSAAWRLGSIRCTLDTRQQLSHSLSGEIASAVVGQMISYFLIWKVYPDIAVTPTLAWGGAAVLLSAPILVLFKVLRPFFDRRGL